MTTTPVTGRNRAANRRREATRAGTNARTGVDGVADEGADGPPVGRAEVLVAVLGRRPAPHRSAGSCRSRGPGSRPRRAAPRIPATHQGAPMAVARWRRWAAIRTGALTSP